MKQTPMTCGSMKKGCHVLGLLLLFVAIPEAKALTVHVVDGDGLPVTTGFRWLLEEDTTFAVAPGGEQVAAEFHRSYMPVKESGSSDLADATLGPASADRRYFLSVRPFAGFSVGGAPVAVGQSEVVVTVHALPLPTAQITVFVFEDNYPLNNAADGEEAGLEGFTVVIEDSGGRYGAVGGQMMLDAFGNMIGTQYDADGNILVMGEGTVKTDASGRAVVKNLPPGKYGVLIIPPFGQPWQQTTTIEGSLINDAWVKAAEPPAFVEFGLPGPHIAVGFVKETEDAAALTGGATITGRAVNFHIARLPNLGASAGGAGLANVWVGLNDSNNKCVYVRPAQSDEGDFSISNVPPGLYQLVVFDQYMGIVIAFRSVQVNAGETEVALGDVQVPLWFSQLFNHVFHDVNENGFPDPGEVGLSDQNINIRFRDGTIYDSMPTDVFGWSPMEQVFPFFNWLVAEVDYTRFKATGVTVVVDEGGVVLPDHGFNWPSLDRLSPQAQPENGGAPYRTELGAVLLEGFQGFLGSTNVLYWGKSAYGADQNGGISGVVFYATTRAENDPRFAAGEPWEPGIPRVVVNLYQDQNNDGVIDDLDGDDQVTLADVDNAPFGWADGQAMGPEDVKRAGSCPEAEPCPFQLGDALQFVTTDSWDDNLPQDCPGDPSAPFYLGGACFDGMAVYNQVRPAVFDGGYAFMDLAQGVYVVEAVPPPGYDLVKEEDKNVDMGESFKISPMALANRCVGDLHVVPDYISAQTDADGVPLAGIDASELVEAPYAGTSRALCDRRQVAVNEGRNAAADFFLFTQVPIAAHFTGMVLNDLAAEFVPVSFNYGEKTGAPFVPVSLRDWSGKEVNRVYTDKYGYYNGLVPANYSANIGSPSGVGAAMYMVCINDSGPVENPLAQGQFIIDPLYRRDYGHHCYTMQFMTGTTTYLDTPLLPTSAFAGKDEFPVDCEFQSGDPVIHEVNGSGVGPWVDSPSGGGLITIKSEGIVTVRNPFFSSSAVGVPPTIDRDMSFGDALGAVRLGDVDLSIVSWTAAEIVAVVPMTLPTGQLTVVRGDNGRETQVGITLTVGPQSQVIRVPQDVATIQGAIDGAHEGALILVAPGMYQEHVILHRKVRLQGSGAQSTIINALSVPTESLFEWNQKIKDLVAANPALMLPGQDAGGPILPEGGLFSTEQGAGILVLAAPGQFTAANSARIDGFTVTGASIGGGIVLNGRAAHMQVSNNRVMSNQGVYSGGIRVGHPISALAFGGQGIDADNDFVTIQHNQVIFNGAIDGGAGIGDSGAGGGISLYNGSDEYLVADNLVCGNFTTGSGAGIGHYGLSDGGRIERNRILFNQSFHQMVYDSSGGGISIEGLPDLEGMEVTSGSGSVLIAGNLIQGNLAEAGDGGGIRLAHINGLELDEDLEGAWTVDIVDNFIVNNVSARAGGGISIQDAIRVRIVNNTIAHNDSTATSAQAFTTGNVGLSEKHPAGIASFLHSTQLVAMLTDIGDTSDPGFSVPVLENDILWKNRSFYYDLTSNSGNGGLLPNLLLGEQPVYWDLGVLGLPAGTALPASYCVMTDTNQGDPTNSTDDPMFVDGYFNGNDPSWALAADREGQIITAPALDEGGNWINIWFNPLTPGGDYHVGPASSAVNAGSGSWLASIPALAWDIDGESRPFLATPVDVGADETDSVLISKKPPEIVSSPILGAKVGTSYTYDVAAIDPDVNDVLVFSLDVAPAGMAINASSGLVTWTPGAGQVGVRAVTVRVTDLGGLIDTQSFSITVLPANTAPVGVADFFALATMGLFFVPAPGVLGNDSDIDGNTLFAIKQSNTTKGTVLLMSNGQILYLPKASFVGTDSFTYKASDGILRSALTTVTLYRELIVTSAKVSKPSPTTFTWVVRGKSAVPGSTVSVYLGTQASGTLIGTATVQDDGLWVLRARNTTINPNLAAALTIVSSTGALLNNVYFQVD